MLLESFGSYHCKLGNAFAKLPNSSNCSKDRVACSKAEKANLSKMINDSECKQFMLWRSTLGFQWNHSTEPIMELAIIESKGPPLQRTGNRRAP